MSDYCLNIVKTHDYDRFLLSLFAPASCRCALWVLFAFNYEIAKTREVVSETTIGLIRLQWWRDAIKEIYEGEAVRQHEVVTPLAQVIKDYDLPRELFDNLIYAREFDLEDVIPADLDGLMKYCEYTSVPLFQLATMIIEGVEKVGDNDTSAVDIYSRYALIGIIRSVPYLFSCRRMMLPEKDLDDNELSVSRLLDFKDQDRLPKLIQGMLMGKSNFRYDSCGQKGAKFQKKLVHMTYLYEMQIKKAGYNVFDPSLTCPPRFFALRLWLGV